MLKKFLVLLKKVQNLGEHKIKLIIFLKKDYIKLNMSEKTNTKRVCKWFDVCPVKAMYEEGRISKKWILKYCFGEWEKCKRYQMEEAGIPHSDNMLPDGSFME